MIPDDIFELMTEMTEPELRHLSQRAQEFADQLHEANSPRKRSAAEIKYNVDKNEFPRDEAPENATLVTKCIDDRDYFYWNWREDDTIRSEYIKPVKPKK